MAAPCYPGSRFPAARKSQQGQALVYGLFVLIGGLASLFFLFNTGQLTREKTKLVNTSDAVAYSAGVMNARTLNYQAYTAGMTWADTQAFIHYLPQDDPQRASFITGTVDMKEYLDWLHNNGYDINLTAN